MRVHQLLASKGSDVVTVPPDTTVTQLMSLLSEHNIGAVVVSEGDGSVTGIVSERDIVRALSRDTGAAQAPVHQIMTSDVCTCDDDCSVEELMIEMTEQRARHLPVLKDGRMVGIVSIGDVVKSRITQLEFEREQLTSYLAQ
ncbi:MAG: histidine kinase [Micrococcales bacterium]|nr:MAG: histidine kinase [Micrococcales bacterium]PIE26458.1 MAG: histidine kinase [Micrococcales bacterium]